MSNARTLFSVIAFGLSLFASTVAFQPGALAQIQGAYEEQISAFSLKLKTARSTQADLSHRVICLEQRDADLAGQRDKLENRLGLLRSEEKDLASKAQVQESAFNQFKADFEAEQSKVAGLRKTIEELPERERYERWRKDCASTNAWDRMACGRHLKLDVFRGFEKYEASLNDARRREQIAFDSMNAANRDLDHSDRQLATTRSQLSLTGLAIDRTENEIVSVKQTLSDVRGFLQPFRIVIEKFTNALNEAKDANLEAERPRKLRTLGDIAQQIDSAEESGANAASNTDRTLGQGWMKACAVS